MIVEYIRYVVPEARAEEFERGYRRATAVLESAPECLGYEVARCADEAGAYVVRIEWRSAEAHLGGFRSGPQFPAFLAEVRPFIGAIAEMRHYEVVTSSRATAGRC